MPLNIRHTSFFDYSQIIAFIHYNEIQQKETTMNCARIKQQMTALFEEAADALGSMSSVTTLRKTHTD